MSRTLSQDEKEALPTLSIEIPKFPGPSSPFNSGVRIELYKSEDLKKEASSAKTNRTNWFEQQLWAIWRAIKRPVPYAFNTPEGRRSLDAGCIGYLLNKPKPEIIVHTDSNGYIYEVEPTGELLGRYLRLELKLVSELGYSSEQNLPSAANAASAVSVSPKRDESSFNRERLAQSAWLILISVAKSDGLITYGDLGKALGIHHRSVRIVLTLIQDYCLEQKNEPLTALVVSKDGVPGEGFIAWDVDDIGTALARIRAFDWSTIGNPFDYAQDGTTVGQLAVRLVSDPTSAEDIYRQVKVRGTAQLVFRQALLKKYGPRCAMCGLTYEPALEACHIIPWCDATHAERVNPLNGILLCNVHHKLFDRNIMTISKSGKIVLDTEVLTGRANSEADLAVTKALHGKLAYLPSDQRNRPSVELLTRHHHECEWGDLP